MKGDTELEKFANQLSAVGTGTDGGIGMVRYVFKLAAVRTFVFPAMLSIPTIWSGNLPYL